MSSARLALLFFTVTSVSSLVPAVVSRELDSSSAPPRAAPHPSPSLASPPPPLPLSPSSLSPTSFPPCFPPETLTSLPSLTVQLPGPTASVRVPVCVCVCVLNLPWRVRQTHPYNHCSDPAAAAGFDIIALTFTCHYRNLST